MMTAEHEVSTNPTKINAISVVSDPKNSLANCVIMSTEALQQMMTATAQQAATASAQQTIMNLMQFCGIGDQNLDNSIGLTDVSEGDTDMAKQKKIRRPIEIDGKVHWISANNEQEYAIKCAIAMQNSITAPASEPNNSVKHNFKQYADRWFNTFSKPNTDDATAITNERQLRLHIYPILGNKCLEDITSADVQEIFNRMGKEVAKETKLKVRNVLNPIFEQAIDDDIIRKNPLHSSKISIKGRQAKETELYTIEQMQYIIQNIDKVKNPRDRAWLALSALHPLSLEESLGLMGDDIDDEFIHVRRAVTHPKRNQPVIKDPKVESRKRRFDLAPQIKKYLPDAKPDEFIIGGEPSRRGKKAEDTKISSRIPMSYQQVRRMCERIRDDIGFDEDIVPRRFRTTVLSDIYDQTKDIKQAQAAAGHTTATMTLKHYVKGRYQGRNTATPVAAAYGLIN